MNIEDKVFDLIELYDNDIGLTIKVYKSSIVDWCISIGFKVTKEVYAKKQGYKNPIIEIQDINRTRAFAKAYIELTEWLSEHFGGY